MFRKDASDKRFLPAPIVMVMVNQLIYSHLVFNFISRLTRHFVVDGVGNPLVMPYINLYTISYLLFRFFLYEIVDLVHTH